MVIRTNFNEAKTYIFLVEKGMSLAALVPFAKSNENELNGDAKEITTFFHEEKKYVLIGVGEQPQPKDFRSILRSVLFQLKKKLKGEVVLDLKSYQQGRNRPLLEEEVAAMVEGYHLSLYEIGFLKTQEKPAEVHYKLVLQVEESFLEIAKKASEKGKILADGVLRAAHLINIPSNKKTAVRLVDFAKEAGEKAGFSVRAFIGKDEIAKERLFALKAVNQGSTNPPAFIIMEYKPAENLPKVGLVGKGITFDTGGISIKDSQNMYYMKSDMGGAATVIGTLETVARLGLPVHLIGIVPATDNMPDGGALQPSDVIDSYAGITIEVEDTDAEGRLILADGLAYLEKNYQPDVMIDFATLTGSSIMALGYVAAALFTANDTLAQQLYEAGQRSDNRVWRLPLWDDYAKQNHSDVADVKNIGGSGAGAITAAKFLEKFTNNHKAWAHLDIAGVAYADSEFSKMRSGTGFGVRLMVEFLEKWLALRSH